MSIESSHLGTAVLLGIGATLLMDLWNLLLLRAFGIPSLNYCLLGRWVSHMPTGTFRHAAITSSQPKRLECAIGWMSHYTIGIVLGTAFVILAPPNWLDRPTPLPALLFGIATVVFPLFIMQPSLGLGIASSKTRAPMQARLKSLATHTVFGLGLYACALVLASLRIPG